MGALLKAGGQIAELVVGVNVAGDLTVGVDLERVLEHARIAVPGVEDVGVALGGGDLENDGRAGQSGRGSVIGAAGDGGRGGRGAFGAVLNDTACGQCKDHHCGQNQGKCSFHVDISFSI